MKKFIVSIVIGITFIAMGATMLFFEIKDYESENVCDLLFDQDKTIRTFDVSNEDLKIYFDSRATSYEWEYDDSLDNEVKVEMIGTMDFRINNNKLTIDDDYDHISSRYVKPVEIFDKVLDGLKNKKLYYCNESMRVKITCSRDARNRIQISYD